jgi:hypothetical protein
MFFRPIERGTSGGEIRGRRVLVDLLAAPVGSPDFTPDRSRQREPVRLAAKQCGRDLDLATGPVTGVAHLDESLFEDCRNLTRQCSASET